MTRFAPLVLILALFMLFFAPWPLPAALALLLGPFVPAAPFAFGILFDVLHKTPSLFPFASLIGLAGSVLALVVRARLAPGIIAQ